MKCPECGCRDIKQREGQWFGPEKNEVVKVTFTCGGRYQFEDGEVTKVISKCKGK